MTSLSVRFGLALMRLGARVMGLPHAACEVQGKAIAVAWANAPMKSMTLSFAVETGESRSVGKAGSSSPSSNAVQIEGGGHGRTD